MDRLVYICSKYNVCKDRCKAHGYRHTKKSGCDEDCSVYPYAKCVIDKKQYRTEHNNRGRVIEK